VKKQEMRLACPTYTGRGPWISHTVCRTSVFRVRRAL
jgi:hypothetical protein